MAWYSCGTSNSGNVGCLTLVPALGALFFLLACLAWPCYDGLCLVLLYLFYAMFAGYPQETCSFLKGNEEGVDLGERGSGVGLGGVEGRETVLGCNM